MATATVLPDATAAWSDDEAVVPMPPAPVPAPAPPPPFPPQRMPFYYVTWYGEPFQNGGAPGRMVNGNVVLDEPYASIADAHVRQTTVSALVKSRPRPRRSRR